MLIQRSARCKGVVHAIANRVTKFGFGHTSVEGECRDDVDIVNASIGGHIKNCLDDALTNVGALHLGKGQAHVIKCDGELHAWEQLLGQRILLDGVEQCMTNSAINIFNCG